MAGEAPAVVSKLANAFIADAKLSQRADALTAPSTKLVLNLFKRTQGGMWVGGAVSLAPDTLTFKPNAVNRAVHENVSTVTIPLARVVRVADRFGWLTRIVDVSSDDGSGLTFRCFGAKPFAEKIAAAAQRCRAG
jgi:hypothetical protein